MTRPTIEELEARVREALDTRCVDQTWEREDCPMLLCVCAESDASLADLAELAARAREAEDLLSKGSAGIDWNKVDEVWAGGQMLWKRPRSAP